MLIFLYKFVSNYFHRHERFGRAHTQLLNLSQGGDNGLSLFRGGQFISPFSFIQALLKNILENI